MDIVLDHVRDDCGVVRQCECNNQSVGSNRHLPVCVLHQLYKLVEQAVISRQRDQIRQPFDDVGKTREADLYKCRVRSCDCLFHRTN